MNESRDAGEANLAAALGRIRDTAWPGIAEQVAEYLASDGARPVHPTGAPLILLTTRGRRTGELWRTVLLHGEDAGDLIVVGSAGGRDAHPGWYLNLDADPSVIVQRGSRAYRAHASLVSDLDRARLWQQLLGLFPPYEELQAKTSRLFPVVRLRESR